MSKLFDSRAKVLNDPGATEAWNMAKPFQQTALGGINNIANQLAENPAYAGQRVAGLNPFQTAAANNLGGFAGNTAGFAQNFMNAGLGNLGAGAGVGANSQNIFNTASMDPTQGIIGAAGMYANNPYVDGMINAAGRDTVRQLTEQALPSLARGAAGTGNTNSTRAGVESAIAERGAADRLADISSNIRSQFFGQGLNMAQNQYNQNLQNMMAANQGLMQAGQFGAGLLGAGQDFASNAFNQGNTAGGLYQNQQQNELNAQKDFFNESWQNPLSAFQALSQNAANATQVKTSAGIAQNPSIASQVGGFVGSLFGGGGGGGAPKG